MNEEKQALIAKQLPPSWLKILVICLLGLGIFFRFTHLGQKAYWYDECFTSLAISGYTVAEVKQEVFKDRVIPVANLKKYQQINPARGVSDTIRYLMTSDPQHPPLYYVMARLWAQVFGDSPAGVRSLSAVISLLIFPSVYWLCLELFESPIVGWVAIAVMAVSPLQLFYAQDARQYGLWMVTILLSSAALLQAIRRETLGSWLIYTLTLALGLYTHLFTAMVVMAHGIYVAFRQSLFNKILINYLLGTTVASLMFLPWLIVLIPNINTIKQLTSSLSFNKINNPFELLAIWMTRITRIFFDINLGSDKAWITSLSSLDEPLFYSMFMILGGLFLIIYLFLFVKLPLTNTAINTSLFLGLLGGSNALLLLLPDLIFGGIRSITFRYQLPLYLSLQIAIAYVLAFHIFSEKTGRKKIWQVLMVGLIVAGLVSNVMFFNAETWWTQASSKTIQGMAKIINQFDSPLLVSSDHIIYNLGATLTLSHFLEPKVRLLPVHHNHLPTIDQNYNDILFFDYSNSLLPQIKNDQTFSLKLIYLPGELWQIQQK